MPHPHQWQQSGFNDVQLLQQHIMFKKLQELQRQQQLQQLGDARQQNSINQLSAITKQAAGGQFPPLINGTPLHDTSQMFMNRVQRGASTAVQGVPNGLMFSQEQGQALRSMGRVSQQLDVSLYGTPIANARGNLNQYSHFQGISNDRANLMTKASGNQTQKPVMQSSAFSNSILGDHCTVSPEQVFMASGAFISKPGFQGKNLFGQVPIQGLHGGNLLENFQHTLQKNASEQEFNGRQERTGWPGLVQEKPTQISPSQGLVPLDPLEEKILFNTDDNIWDASFPRRTEQDTGRFGNTMEHTDYLNSFPSIQSGSWSALMQSAVAEASSSDTGLQEEWSGLTFQNMELSADNQPSNFMDSGKQQADCVDNNLQSVSSLSSKPFSVFNDSNMSSSFPGFQHSGIQFSSEQRDGLHRDSPHELIQQSPRSAGNWLEFNPQQMPPIEERQQVQPVAHLENAWSSQTYEHSESEAHQQSRSSYDQQRNKSNGRNIESLSSSGNATLNICNDENAVDTCWKTNVTMHKERNSDGCLWKTDGNHGASIFSNSIVGLEQIQSHADTTLVNREVPQKNFAAVPKSSTTKADQETSQQVPDSHQFDYMKHGDVSVQHRGDERMGNEQHELRNGPQVLDNSYNGAREAYVKRQNSYQRENSNDSYNSIASQHKITERESSENVWSNASDSQRVARNYQNSSSQVSQGLTNCEQGNFGQSKLIDNVSNSAMDLEKEHFPEFQGNFKASEDVPSIGNLGSNISASFDKLVGLYGPNFTAQTR
ncbi:hypothetical protein L1049_003335 [Liquidambar formosana]|uniref:Uncharacterized protein n=1 Tax=Liquidambar formosana TaxID=63359 RepID=A0AAP0R814_LIQFO